MDRLLIGAAALVALGVVVWVTGTSTPPGLEGVWFSETRDRSTLSQQIVEYRDNGRFRAATRLMRDCEPERLVVREGRWWREAERFTRQIDTVDGVAIAAAVPAPEIFEIIVLRADRLVFRDPTGRDGAALRASVDFEFPEPAGCPEPPPGPLPRRA